MATNQNKAGGRGALVKIPNVPCLYRYPNGTYYAVKKHKGKIHSASLEVKDRKLAELKLKDWVEALEKTGGESWTLGEAWEKYAALMEGKSESSRHNLQWAREVFMGHYPHPPTVELRKIKVSDLGATFAKIEKSDLSPRSYNLISMHVNACLNLGVAEGVLAENPLNKLPKRRLQDKRKKPTVPTIEQFDAICGKLWRKQTRDWVRLMGYAAIGEAELQGLRWEHIRWDEKRILIQRQKTGEHFYVPFYPWLEKFLTDFHKRNGEKKVGKVFDMESARGAINNACKTLGYPHFSPRNFRQMGIKYQIQAGLDPKAVAKFQGHKDGGVLIMNTYSEVFAADDEKREREMIASLKG